MSAERKGDGWRIEPVRRSGRDSMAESHLVIRAPNWVGDLVMATPILEAALDEPRWAKVSVVCRAKVAPVLAGGPLERHLKPVPRGMNEVRHLISLRADAALLLSNSLGAAWRARRARIPIRAGAALSGRRFLLTHAVVPPRMGGRRAPIPTQHLMRDAAGLLGIQPRDMRPRLSVTEGLRERARRILAQQGLEPGGGYVVCTPGASFGASKLWPPKRFAAVLDHLFQTRGWCAVVSGAPGEEDLVSAIVQECTHPALPWPQMDDGLAVLKALIEGASFVLGGDNGPRWYAAAFQVPCVTVMGPNFPELTPPPPEGLVVRREGLECMPCAAKVCPLGHHRCMTELEVPEVVQTCELALESASPWPPTPSRQQPWGAEA